MAGLASPKIQYQPLGGRTRHPGRELPTVLQSSGIKSRRPWQDDEIPIESQCHREILPLGYDSYMQIKALVAIMLLALGCSTPVEEPAPPAPPSEPVVDPVTAFKEAKVRAEQGSAVDQENLGRLYLEGTGVEQSDAEAAKWSRTSAEAGYAPAQRGFAVLLIDGRGVIQDFAAAVEWLEKAAEQGDPVAQERLASAYWRGIGTKRQDAKAYAWASVAAANGLESAAGLRDFIVKYLTPEEIVEVQELAAEYFEKYKTPVVEVEVPVAEVPSEGAE